MPLKRILVEQASVDQAREAQAAMHGLQSPHAASRRAAVQVLAGQPEATGALVAALRAERERSVLTVLLAALGASGDEEAIAALADCLRSEDAWLRNAAIDVLRELPAQVAPALAPLLADWDRDVRILAVGILDTLRHERAEQWLLQLIEADQDLNVCGAALEVLATIATPAANAPVRRMLARWGDEPYLAFAGKLVLARSAEAADA
jgi:HEAT repeat protein